MELRVAPAQVEGILLEDLPKAFSGKPAGQQVSLKSKVPAAHPTEAWRNKDVTITFKIKQVRRLQTPKADDEFAKQAGFENLGQMRAFLHTRLEAQAATEQHRAMQAQVASFLGEKISIEIPTGMAERQSQRLLTRRVVDLMYRGVPREQIEANLEGLKAEAAQRAKADLKRSFILDKLAQAENIKVEDAEVNARVAQMARQSNRRPERFKQEMKADGSLDELTMSLAEEKALDKVLELAKLVEPKAKPAEPKAKVVEPKAKVVEPEAKVVEPKAKPAAHPAPHAATKAKAKPETKSDAEPKAKHQAKPKAKHEAKPKAAKKTKPKE
jgi:trigger factor